MNVVVCVKQVPDTSDPDTEVHMDSSGRDVDQSKFSFVINDADNYAVEEAILLKEKHGGEVTVVNIGPETANQVIRMALAKGGDSAIRLDDEKFEFSDAIATARLLAAAVKDLGCDIVMTGCMASDDGYARRWGRRWRSCWAFRTRRWSRRVEVVEDGQAEGRARARGRTDGDGTRSQTPCVLTIQTGRNEPRYASFKGIREASKKEIKLMDLGSHRPGRGPGRRSRLRSVMVQYSVPEVGELAEILEGDAGETSGKLAGILKEKGLV